MNAKTVRKYNLIISIAATDAESPDLPKSLAELCSIDFQSAFEMWEYMLTENQPRLADKTVCANLEEKPFGMFMRISETKTKQLFFESLPLTKLIYQQCESAASGTNLDFLTSAILGGKLDFADEVLRNVRANTSGDPGARMRVVVDSVFSAYCNKHNVKVPALNKKQEKLLISHIEKIKGPNKTLLMQRIKEIA